MPIFGMLRVKNESRWISDVLRSIAPLCERIFVLDDDSTDGTPEICQGFNGPVELIRSPFISMGLDESRDKNYLLGRAFSFVPPEYLLHDMRSPYWCLAIDGDEYLDRGGLFAICEAIRDSCTNGYSLPVRYLWDSDLKKFPHEKRIRIDGIYRNFARPSLFRLFDRSMAFQSTTRNGNLHCSSIPGQLLTGQIETIGSAELWHFGYNYRNDRVRKYNWYNTVDPNNEFEDFYRHCVQGDLPEVPAKLTLRHAGPLLLADI